MSTSATAAPAARAAFTQFVDYAGLFPPAKLDAAPALAEYAGAKAGGFAWMLGRFIVPASRIPELLAALRAGEALELSVIVDAGADSRTWLSRVQQALAQLSELHAGDSRVRIHALEAALPPLQTQRESYDAAIGQFAAAIRQAGFDAMPAFVEVPRDARWEKELDGALFALSRHRLGAKLRCGGVTQEAFPSAQEVATFVCSAVQQHQLPMKATAGLHHPVRHYDSNTGVMMHGFLNVLAAAAFARAGMDYGGVLGIASCEDASRFDFGEGGVSWNGCHVGLDDLRRTRAESFVSYGSCSFAEPVADLQALGIL